jgi:hypothetical protein
MCSQAPCSPDHSRQLQRGIIALACKRNRMLQSPPEALAQIPLLPRAPESSREEMCAFYHSWRAGHSPVAPKAPLCLELSGGLGRPLEFLPVLLMRASLLLPRAPERSRERRCSPSVLFLAPGGGDVLLQLPELPSVWSSPEVLGDRRSFCRFC